MTEGTKRGGARLGNPNGKRGGARLGNPNGKRGGVQLVQRITLNKETARTLKLLLKVQGIAYTQENVNIWITGMIQKDWERYDAMIEREANEAAATEVTGERT